MASKLTGAGWIVEPDVVDERAQVPRLTSAQITEINARIAAGSNEFPIGTKVLRTDDMQVLTLQGVGVAARFDLAVTGTASASALAAHIANVANPHVTTKAQVGLGSVDNTADADKPVSTAQAAAIAAAFGQGWVTGDFKFHMGTTAPAGWIAANGAQTIGNTGSGATLTGAAYQALFTYWWGQFNDATLPILTSAGGASTRGASAAADWAALKRLNVFNLADRFPRVQGMNNPGLLQAQQVGPHTHEIASGTATGGGNTRQVVSTISTPQGDAMTGNGSTASVPTGTENRPPAVVMLGCFKL